MLNPIKRTVYCMTPEEFYQYAESIVKNIDEVISITGNSVPVFSPITCFRLFYNVSVNPEIFF